MKKIIFFVALCATVFLWAGRASGAENSSSQGQAESATDLAKKTQNPISDLISLPFQYNVYFETGPKAKTQNVLLIQPVMPFSMNADWQLQFQIQFLFPK